MENVETALNRSICCWLCRQRLICSQFCSCSCLYDRYASRPAGIRTIRLRISKLTGSLAPRDMRWSVLITRTEITATPAKIESSSG